MMRPSPAVAPPKSMTKLSAVPQDQVDLSQGSEDPEVLGPMLVPKTLPPGAVPLPPAVALAAVAAPPATAPAAFIAAQRVASPVGSPRPGSPFSTTLTTLPAPPAVPAVAVPAATGMVVSQSAANLQAQQHHQLHQKLLVLQQQQQQQQVLQHPAKVQVVAMSPRAATSLPPTIVHSTPASVALLPAAQVLPAQLPKVPSSPRILSPPRSPQATTVTLPVIATEAPALPTLPPAAAEPLPSVPYEVVAPAPSSRSLPMPPSPPRTERLPRLPMESPSNQLLPPRIEHAMKRSPVEWRFFPSSWAHTAYPTAFVYVHFFALACLAMFSAPVAICLLLATDANVQYWLGYWAFVALVVPFLVLLGYAIHLRRGRLALCPIVTSTLIPSVLLLCIGLVHLCEMHGALPHSLISHDCNTYGPKYEVEQAWRNASSLYAECRARYEEPGRGFRPFRFEECEGYQMASRGCDGVEVDVGDHPMWRIAVRDVHGLFRTGDVAASAVVGPCGMLDIFAQHRNAWTYLRRLELEEHCSGWCQEAASPLWTSQEAKDSCSAAASQVITQKIRPMSWKLVELSLVALLLSVVGIGRLTAWGAFTAADIFYSSI